MPSTEQLIEWSPHRGPETIFWSWDMSSHSYDFSFKKTFTRHKIPWCSWQMWWKAPWRQDLLMSVCLVSVSWGANGSTLSVVLSRNMSKPMLIFTSNNAHKSPAITPFVEKSYLALFFLLQRLGRRLTLSVLNNIKDDGIWVSPGPTV